MVAILIISLGISIYNSSSGISDEASSTLESTAAFAFNERFTSYMSKSASGSTAKTLVNKIMQHNMSIGLSSFSAGDHHILLNLYYNDNNSRSKFEHCWKTTDLKKIYNKLNLFTYILVVVIICRTLKISHGEVNEEIIIGIC